MKKKTLKDFLVIELPLWQLEERDLDDLSVLHKMSPKELYALAKELKDLPEDEKMTTDDYGVETEMGAEIFGMDEFEGMLNDETFPDYIGYYYVLFLDKDDLN